MTFPETIRVITAELKTGPSTWEDISADLQQRDGGITITRGKNDLNGQVPASTCTFKLNNRNGRYSPRNPLSDLYGLIGRGTQVRFTVDDAAGGASVRFVGELTSLPPSWDTSGNDAWVTVSAAGLLRRYEQGSDPATTGLREWVLGQPATLAAYYPLGGGEETTYSQNIAPGKTGSFAGFGGAVFKYGVDLGPSWLGTGLEINATGDLPYMQGIANAVGTNIALDFVFQSQAFGVLDVQIWPTVDSIWNLRMNTSSDDGTLQVSYNDGDSAVTNALPSSAIDALQDTQLHTCRFELHQTAGPFVDFFVYIDGELVYSVEGFLSVTMTRSPFFRLHYSRFTGQTVVNVAHFAMWADNTASNLPTAADYHAAAMAYAGETAADRMTRITGLADWPFEVDGDAADTMLMGPLFSETRLQQLRDAEATDLGMLMDKRDELTLVYRTRRSMYSQTPAFTLDKSAGEVAPPFEPAEDDEYTRNIVTATKREGASVRVEKDTGPLSTQDPPDGVGPYYEEITVNVETDAMLDGVAEWQLNLGTVDETRYPTIRVDLSNPNVVAAGLEQAVLEADLGDKLRVENADASFIYDDVDQLIVGYVETINAFEHSFAFNCVPASPYDVAGYATDSETGDARYDTNGSELASGVTSSATSLSVTDAGGTLWTRDSDAFPLDVIVGGERMTVTNITGATSPQTFTVTRSVNGVVTAHDSGTDVRLYAPARYAL